MSLRFPAAPWPASLAILSLLGSVVLVGASYAAYRAAPTLGGSSRDFRVEAAAAPLIVLGVALLFVVRGYRVEKDRIVIERLVTATSVPLTGLVRVWTEPGVCKGSLRIFGNGGLFAFSGWYYSKRLGRYRLFATDLHKAAVLRFRDRVLVVSPAEPQAFVAYLGRVVPDLTVGPELSATR